MQTLIKKLDSDRVKEIPNIITPSKVDHIILETLEPMGFNQFNLMIDLANEEIEKDIDDIYKHFFSNIDPKSPQ